MATETLNDALAALSRLLDAISDQIELRPQAREEGSIRLAMMVIFRQFWHPEGYVAGKLVGYKNLLPDQQETFKRRTFIKTSRETTSAQEFLSAREEDFSSSSKETQEVVAEATRQFNFNANVSGGFDIAIAELNVDLSTGLQLSATSRSTQSRVGEAAMKSSRKYSEKREVKIRNLTDTEDVQEVTVELKNSNHEITSNTFFYQLYRQYRVSLELHELRPVLLRARDLPSPAEVDDSFLCEHAHVLVNELPPQLSSDLQETVGDIDELGRVLVRRRADSQERRAVFERLRQEPLPADPQERSKLQAQLESAERLMRQARTDMADAESAFLRARNRLDRVVKHVRDNICFYMQRIWHSAPTVDQDLLLQDEEFHGTPLPAVTRGLMRHGYFGDEEVFDFSGQSLPMLELILRNVVSGADVAGNSGFKESRLHQQLQRHYGTGPDASASGAQIMGQVFLRDPASGEDSCQTASFRLRRMPWSWNAFQAESHSSRGSRWSTVGSMCSGPALRTFTWPRGFAIALGLVRVKTRTACTAAMVSHFRRVKKDR